jgi:hypothetical protein
MLSVLIIYTRHGSKTLKSVGSNAYVEIIDASLNKYPML